MKHSPQKNPLETVAILSAAALLLVTAWQKWLPLDVTEVSEFATGAIFVWLVAKGHIWNWPVRIAYHSSISKIGRKRWLSRQ